MIDSHCHLADPVFAPDLDEVLARGREAGITHVLCILAAGDAAEQAQAERVAAQCPGARFAVGVHPHQAHESASDGSASALVRAACAGSALVRAIGEIGLDFHRNLSPPDAQREALGRQLDLAARHRLPVLVHDREAHDDVVAALAGWASPHRPRGLLHAFSGNRAMAERLTAAGFVVSFALPVAFRSAAGPREAAAGLADGAFVVETDSPYLGPDASGRNEPTTAIRVATELARLRAAAVEDLVAPIRLAYDRALAG
jgi:TatD DNase family protein